MGRLDDILSRNSRSKSSSSGDAGLVGTIIRTAGDPTLTRRSRWFRIIGALVAMAVLAAAVGGLMYLLKTGMKHRPDGRVPSSTLRGYDDQTVRLSSLWDEHRLYVVVYPTLLCEPCSAQFKQLDAHRDELDGRLVVIGFDHNREVEPLRKTLALGFELFTADDPGSFSAWGIPAQRTATTGPSIAVVERGGSQISYRKTCHGVEHCDVSSELAAAAHAAGAGSAR